MSQNYVEKAVVDMAILDLLAAYEIAMGLERELSDPKARARTQKIASILEASLSKISCYGTAPVTAQYIQKIQGIKEEGAPRDPAG